MKRWIFLTLALFFLIRPTAWGRDMVEINSNQGYLLWLLDRGSIVQNGEIVEFYVEDEIDVYNFTADCRNNLIRMTKSSYPDEQTQNFSFHSPDDWELPLLKYVCRY